MSAFDSSELGTPESAWAASDRLAGLRTVDAPGRDRRIVLLAAHPDDETLGAGGLLATAAAAGLHIDVLVASDGAASHPDSPTHTPADLAAIRADELRAAVALLAPGASLRQLDLPDGGFFMPLFVVLRPGQQLDAELESRLRRRLRAEYTPRHVPDAIISVGALPLTRSGKKMEIPVRRVLLGADPADVADPNAMADPDAFADIAEYARTQSDYTR